MHNTWNKEISDRFTSSLFAFDSKYDRQMRLWGDHGQNRLNESSICILGASAVATESVKNLILPGIKQFTLIEDKVVTKGDIGQNYFLSVEDEGNQRATAVLPKLLELNPAVEGTALVMNPCDLIELVYNNYFFPDGSYRSCFSEDGATKITEVQTKYQKLDPSATQCTQHTSFFEGFSLLICTQLPLKFQMRLGKIAALLHVPLISLNSLGMFASLRIFAKEHVIIQHENRNITNAMDLRLNGPFDELESFVDNFCLDELDDVHRAHVPFLILLKKTMQKWRHLSATDFPKTTEEKDLFKTLLLAYCRSSSDANASEALKHVHLVFERHEIPLCVQNILEEALDRCRGGIPSFDDSQSTVSRAQKRNNCMKTERSSIELSENEKFWWLARAVAAFVDANKVLPLKGDLPDMTSDTSTYMEIQSIYRKRAMDDILAVKTSLCIDLNHANGKPTSNMPHISDDYISFFCRNARQIKIIKYRELVEEYNSQTIQRDAYISEMKDHESLLPWYIIAWAADRFNENFQRYPGCDQVRLNDDVEKLQEEVRLLLQYLHFDDLFTVESKIIKQFAYFGGCEMHTTSAFIGGIAAQEAIKLLSNQFLPLNNTYLWNAIVGRGQALEL
ncbi:ThiF family protein [Cardiosporidium cionae]|uniref:ThiF family protein n=1 Tax=Cardiosporidium cionae TaxID=476202 RepID=A0ABQ7JGH5_9APIC|nr:ThiF family protein [Cardiosporidium cionae]|eukprot:KAF8822975.1 ThiF family protein [Cardiosporidium cionae]